jgi:phospholipase C
MRRVLPVLAIFAVAPFVAMACGSSDGATPDVASVLDGGTAATDGATTSDAAPVFTGPIPIKHVVVVVKENHTFDNYFGSFPGAEGTSTYKTPSGSFPVPHAPDESPRDLCHKHPCALHDWNNGALDGWDTVNNNENATDKLAFAQYHEADIPNYWAYARKFTLGDHFFANLLGPSFPGHMFFLAAQAGWAVDNPPNDLTHPFWGCDEKSSDKVEIEDQKTCASAMVAPCFKIPSVPDILPTGVDWKFYGTDVYDFPFSSESWSMFDAIDSIRNGPSWSKIVKIDDAKVGFQADLTNHTLPAVSWLVPQDFGDEHPSPNIPLHPVKISVCTGENWTVQHLNMLMKSDYWKDTAVIITMDDFGGWYDHVPPPRQYGCDPTQPYGLGFRLPLIVVSPYAKPGFIFKEVAEQASVPRFIEKVFGATSTLSDKDPAAQDGKANDLMNAFDFTQTPLPPLVLNERTCP